MTNYASMKHRPMTQILSYFVYALIRIHELLNFELHNAIIYSYIFTQPH